MSADKQPRQSGSQSIVQKAPDGPCPVLRRFELGFKRREPRFPIQMLVLLPADLEVQAALGRVDRLVEGPRKKHTTIEIDQEVNNKKHQSYERRFLSSFLNAQLLAFLGCVCKCFLIHAPQFGQNVSLPHPTIYIERHPPSSLNLIYMSLISS